MNPSVALSRLVELPAPPNLQVAARPISFLLAIKFAVARAGIAFSTKFGQSEVRGRAVPVLLARPRQTQVPSAVTQFEAR